MMKCWKNEFSNLCSQLFHMNPYGLYCVGPSMLVCLLWEDLRFVSTLHTVYWKIRHGERVEERPHSRAAIW